MNQVSRNEEEYRRAMDALRFSEADKENLVENLIAAEPVKRRSVRSMRVGLIAACLCLVLAGDGLCGHGRIPADGGNRPRREK